MKRLALTVAASFAMIATAAPAFAALATGAQAPDFTTTAALAGKDHSFSLSKELKKGPVVLYFFPAAFTQGCTLEAHSFAEATPEFEKLGATVVGMTGGNVERIKEFSSSECRDKFAVGAATPKVISDYDVSLGNANRPGWTNRTSYVIAPDGKILLAYTDGDFQHHVTKTMETVKAYKAAAKR